MTREIVSFLNDPAAPKPGVRWVPETSDTCVESDSYWN